VSRLSATTHNEAHAANTCPPLFVAAALVSQRPVFLMPIAVDTRDLHAVDIDVRTNLIFCYGPMDAIS
jgi:hypothetical protein